MASIGGITMLTMNGRPAEPATALDVLERLGTDGAETRDLGIREQVATIRTTRAVAGDAAADLAVLAVRNLVGTQVTVVDAHGIAHENVIVLAAESTIQAILASTTGPADTRLVTTTWTVRKRYLSS